MNNATVSMFRFFFGTDASQRTTQWLRAMANKGLHLHKVSALNRWTFLRGAPADVEYRIDINHQRDAPAYRRSHEAAGWECAYSFMVVYYWRRRATTGQTLPFRANDAANLVQMRRGRLTLILMLVITVLKLLISQPEHASDAFLAWWLVAIFFLELACLFAVNHAIRKLQRTPPTS